MTTMEFLKFVFLIGILGLVHLNIKAQPTHDPGTEKPVFEKIIYHSSHCYGTCPKIDLEIDSNLCIILKREFWKAKGVNDRHGSGNFKGKITPKVYFDLVANLITCDYINLKFPPILCCDGVITTIIVYANGKKTILESMTPPEKARKLISFLYDLGTQLAIPLTTEEIKIEE